MERKANVARCDIIVIGGGAGGVAANLNPRMAVRMAHTGPQVPA